MELKDILQKRYSLRKFDSRKPDREVIRSIAEAALQAPSAHNDQPYRLLIADADAVREQLPEATKSHFDAPAFFLVCMRRDEAWVRRQDQYNAADIDGTILAVHLSLLIEDAGMGSCYVCAFDPQKIREVFHLEAELEPLILLPFGYPAKDAAPSPRHYQRRLPGEICRWL